MVNHKKILEQILLELKNNGIALNEVTPSTIREIFPILDAIPLIIWITDRINPVFLNSKGRAYYNFTMAQIKKEKGGIYARYLHSDTFHLINLGSKAIDKNPEEPLVTFYKVLNGKGEVKWIGNISYLFNSDSAIENDYMLHIAYDTDDCIGKINLFNNGSFTNTEIPTLTEKEYEVLELICKEYTSKEIAKALYISAETVNYHRKKLMDKLNVKSSIGVAMKALQYNLI
ncbi:MAG: LuxR C-terminal-related transcriptional regulator [Chitinophagales bacterium]